MSKQHRPGLWRTFLKQVFNPLILRTAGSAHSPFAVVRHVGRRSGKPYVTPVIVWPVEGGFMFALNYGPDVDWYRNILAAGAADLRWHGRDNRISQPETVDAATGIAAFPAPFNHVLRLRGNRDFFRMAAEPLSPE